MAEKLLIIAGMILAAIGICIMLKYLFILQKEEK